LDGVSEARTKLANQIEGQREEVNMEKHQLISMIPEVENEVENHEDSVSQLMQENNENKDATKDIVNDFGRRWSVSNHVASLQAEKAVLERTIVGLEEKVQELELRNQGESTSRSSVSTVISVDSVRDTAHLSEDDRTAEPENGEALGVKSSNEDSNGDSNGDSNKDLNKLTEKLREYKEMIEEFELIKEDWEGEKEALENVVVQLRQKIKDVEKNQEMKRIEKRYLNDVEELLLKKNYVSEEDLKVSDDRSTREDIVLSFVLKWLRNEADATAENDFVDGLKSPGYNRELSQQMDNVDLGGEGTENELHSTRNELEATRNEYSKTKHQLNETSTRLNEMTHELDKTRLDSEESRVNLEYARVELGEAEMKVTDMESKLKLLKTELEESQVHLNTTISEKENEIHKLKNVVEQLQGTLSNYENDKANVVSGLQQEIGRLQNELVNATSSCETIATHLDQSKQELALVLKARDSLNVQLQEIGKEKEQLLGMVNDRDVRIEELQDLYDSLDQSISLLQDEEKKKTKAFSELSEENSLLKDEKSDLFNLLETKENDLNNSLRESEKLSELLREQELASEEMRRQNNELAKDLENWRIQLEELNQSKDLLNRDLDAKSEEILSLKENNIELANQSYENNEEISQKLSMLEQLVSENMALKSENETLMEALSEKKVSEKQMKDSYNSLLQEKQQLDVSYSDKSLEMDQEIRRKTDELEILRLEVARLTKESHEKDNTIRAQVSANLVSGSSDDVTAKQEQIRRILAEKDVEIDALRNKNESLLTLFAENEQEKGMVSGEHEKQIASILEREERMFNEINEKNDQIIALEDRLEMLNIKSASKDQASALIHAEHQKLLHLNESQSDEIGRLREKVTGLGLLVAERDHNASGEVHKLRQRNSDLQLQVDALQGEQERLLMLVHDKDKQLLIQESTVKRSQELLVNAQPLGDGQLLSPVHEKPIGRTEELLVDAPPSNVANLSHNQDEIRKLADENEKLTEEVIALRNNVGSLRESIESERKTNTSLVRENQLITQRLNSLEATQMESNDKLKKLQTNEERLRQELSVKEREILAGKEENNKQVYEINTLRNEKDELFLEQRSKTEELQTKLSSLLDVICSDVDLKDEQFEILENREDFEKLVSRVKNHRARLLSDKEKEVRSLKEQVETLNSVQNITNPQFEAKLEQFLREKDLMNQKLMDIENEKIELLELKENEMTSLQTQVVDLSNILKQKERQWSAEKDAFSEKNNLLEKHAQILEQERESLNASKGESENEISRLREEVITLTASADQKLDVVSHEKDRRAKDLERELDDLKQRHSRSLQETQSMKSEVDTARKVAQEFEMKKEKELERLRTHLLQVRVSLSELCELLELGPFEDVSLGDCE
jgi:chromosome segregation ATPase